MCIAGYFLNVSFNNFMPVGYIMEEKAEPQDIILSLETPFLRLVHNIMCGLAFNIDCLCLITNAAHLPSQTERSIKL